MSLLRRLDRGVTRLGLCAMLTMLLVSLGWVSAEAEEASTAQGWTLRAADGTPMLAGLAATSVAPGNSATFDVIITSDVQRRMRLSLQGLHTVEGRPDVTAETTGTAAVWAMLDQQEVETGSTGSVAVRVRVAPDAAVHPEDRGLTVTATDMASGESADLPVVIRITGALRTTGLTLERGTTSISGTMWWPFTEARQQVTLTARNTGDGLVSGVLVGGTRGLFQRVDAVGDSREVVVLPGDTVSVSGVGGVVADGVRTPTLRVTTNYTTGSGAQASYATVAEGTPVSAVPWTAIALVLVLVIAVIVLRRRRARHSPGL